MRRDVIWESTEYIGLEHCALEIGSDEIAAEGVIVADFGDGAFRLDYRVVCDLSWSFREAKLSVERGGVHHRIEALRNERGAWLLDGKNRTDLDGCEFIDIRANPFTNTMPIRSLGLAANERRLIRVVYFSVPDLAVSAVEQAYMRLDAGDPPGLFQYHGIASNYLAELSVDSDGLVIDYPPIWRRRPDRPSSIRT